jgi:hypothetical protein
MLTLCILICFTERFQRSTQTPRFCAMLLATKNILFHRVLADFSKIISLLFSHWPSPCPKFLINSAPNHVFVFWLQRLVENRCALNVYRNPRMFLHRNILILTRVGTLGWFRFNRAPHDPSSEEHVNTPFSSGSSRHQLPEFNSGIFIFWQNKSYTRKDRKGLH